MFPQSLPDIGPPLDDPSLALLLKQSKCRLTVVIHRLYVAVVAQKPLDIETAKG